MGGGLEYMVVILYTIMGKQSRRIRNRGQKQTTPPVQTAAPPQPIPTAEITVVSSGQRRTIDITLDPENPEDKPVIDVIVSSKNYKSILDEDIGPRPPRSAGARQYYKYMCRSIRRDQVPYLNQIVQELVAFHVHIKAGLIDKKPLDLYLTNYNDKINLIQFLTHAHNGNTPKANKYYLKWREGMSNRVDNLLFNDCSDEYLIINGKEIDADKDEGVRLLAERIKEDIDFYAKMWPVLLGTELPTC